jgi:hypothetical protein
MSQIISTGHMRASSESMAGVKERHEASIDDLPPGETKIA